MQQYLEEVQTMIRTYTGAPVPESALEELLGIGTLQVFHKGELIIAAGEESSILYILLQGLVRKFYLDAAGNDITHMFQQKNSFFSTDYVMIRQPSLCCFEAAEECRTLTFDYTKVQQVMAREPALLSVYVGILENTLREKLLRENALLSKCATERYLDLKDRIPGIEDRVSQAHIASYIGITPVSLSRIRRTLREENGCERDGV